MAREKSFIDEVADRLADEMQRMVDALIADEIFAKMVKLSVAEQIGRFLEPMSRSQTEAAIASEKGPEGVDAYREKMVNLMLARMGKGD